MLCWTMELLSTISTTALFAETKISASVSLLCGYTISSDPVGASFESPCFGWQALTVLSTKEASKTRFRGIIFYRRVTEGWVFDEERTFTTCGGEGNASPHVSHRPSSRDQAFPRPTALRRSLWSVAPAI